MKIYFHTFGCKVNQCETGMMENAVLAAGAEISGPEDADAIVINSCTVTAEADRKARQYIRKYCRLNPQATIYFTGCYADRDIKDLKTGFPDVVFFTNSRKENICDIIDFSYSTSAGQPASGFFARTRAFVKIQDGCDGNCSYCIVPKIRSRMSSENPEDIFLEIKNHAAAGRKEIVLCGVRLGKYLWKGGGRQWALADVIGGIEKIGGIERIRLSSIDLLEISDELVELMARSKKMCLHLHIPLQSGDDETLKKMRRPYDTKTFFEKIESIRKRIPDIGITTDVIIGFPTETEENFKNSRDFIKKCGFSRLHIFRYSPRPGTDAAGMEPVFGLNRLAGREAEMKSLDIELRAGFAKKFKGRKLEVLTEANGCGYTSNYIRVKLPPGTPLNEIIEYEQ